MKLKLLTIGVLMSLSTACLADVTGYVGVKSGVSSIKGEIDEYDLKDFEDTVANLSFFGGAKFHEKDSPVGGRIELDWTHYFKAKDDISPYSYIPYNMEIKMDTLMANAYLDLYPADWVNFYLTVGAGSRFADYKGCIFSECISDDDNGFAFKGGAGVMFNIGDHFSIDLGYRYTHFDTDLYSHDAQAGFVFSF